MHPICAIRRVQLKLHWSMHRFHKFYICWPFKFEWRQNCHFSTQWYFFHNTSSAWLASWLICALLFSRAWNIAQAIFFEKVTLMLWFYFRTPDFQIHACSACHGMQFERSLFVPLFCLAAKVLEGGISLFSRLVGAKRATLLQFEILPSPWHRSIFERIFIYKAVSWSQC